MPKTYNHLFDQIVSIDNLYDAFHKAQRGRRKKPDVLAATYEREAFLHDLHERLAAGTWTPEPYHTFLCKTEVKSRIIRDRRVLGLLDTLIDSYHSDETGEGIPIGAMTSQLFANLYLNELDHFVKDELGCKCYVRYMDDFLLFGEKAELKALLGRIVPFLARLHLHLNDRTRLAPAKHGVDFAGYRTFVTHVAMRKRNVKAARRRFRRYERLYAAWRVDVPDVTRRVASFLGYARHAASYMAVRSVLGAIHLKRNSI